MRGEIEQNATRRLLAVFGCTVFSLGYSFVCSRWTNSDGRSAAFLNLANVLLLGTYARRYADRALVGVFLAAAAFGLVELLADFLCVRCTRTLDYSVARSAMVFESPWWMPLSWAVVAVQMAVPGDAAIRRYGVVRGMALTGVLASLVIPFYEEMAWGANWWRYRNCLRLGHTPVYIMVAEAVIGAGLALMGFGVLRARDWRTLLLYGTAAGLATILGGTAGWGLVEFLCRGERPYPI